MSAGLALFLRCFPFLLLVKNPNFCAKPVVGMISIDYCLVYLSLLSLMVFLVGVVAGHFLGWAMFWELKPEFLSVLGG